MSLAELQRDFCAYLARDDQGTMTGIAAGAERGMPVYHHAFRETLIAALQDTYAKTHLWLGDEQFDAAARNHIASAHPSSWTLADYGTDFDQTLANLYPDDPDVLELGWLDQALRSAFASPDCAALNPATLAEVDWDNAVLKITPTIVFREIVTNAPAIWQALADEVQPPPVQLFETPAVVSVWRHDLEPRFLTISGDEYRALRLAAKGKSFTSICDSVFADHGPDVAGEMLGRWITDGIVIAVGSNSAS